MNGATVVGSLAEFANVADASHVVVDLAGTDAGVVAEMGARFRSRGIGFTVAARPGASVPFEVRRNLAHDA